MLIIITVLLYFAALMLFSRVTARRGDNNQTFFRANRRSPWYMVAFGMVGASISGITFVSVPGMTMFTGMTYVQMCIGFILGYFAVAFVLLPVYYRLNLTTIYRRAFLRCVHHLATLCARRNRCAVCPDGCGDGGADMAVHPTGRHKDLGLDRYVSNYMYVCCPYTYYI